MYIDHISGSLQNFNNSMRGLQNLAELDEQRRTRQLNQSIDAILRGDSDTSEKLFLQSQRGLFGNIFGSDSKERTFNNPYAKEKVGLQSLIETPEQQQVQTLKDINAVNELKKIYGNNTEALNKQLGLMGLTQTPQDIISGYDNKVAQNKQITADNFKREAYNKSLANQVKEYIGTEEEKQQQLLNDAYSAIKNSATPQEQLKNYMQYRVTAKSIADYHRRRDFNPFDAGYFGIGTGSVKGESGSGKPDDVYIKDLEGNAIKPLKLTEKQINDKDIKKKLFEQYKEELATKGIYRWEDLDVGYASGNSFNLSTEDKMKIKISKQLEKEKLQNALTMLNQSTGWDVGDATKGTRIDNKDEARAYIAGLGLEAYQDKDGKWQVKPGRGVAKAQPQNEVDQFLGD